MTKHRKKTKVSLKNLFMQGVVLIGATFFLQLFLPWWIVAVVAFILSYFLINSLISGFLISFLSVFLLWTSVAIVSDRNFDSSMAVLIGKILGDISPSIVFFITGALGGFVAGLGGMMGAWTRLLAQK